ncbi:MAG: hypothetical protein H5U08_14320 [Thermogutta sp.]|uniref:hypothetical protein n=1 Tax=Thermogutta sp. TaxID=1962930 RepID=UPI0019AEB703|nr:hypothetical protein [Thermogutta sp.]MBC7353533.1 hypothetical protein [Thermogutta sp.]
MAEAPESSSKQRSESDPWSKLAEFLGLRPADSGAESSQSSPASATPVQGSATDQHDTPSESQQPGEQPSVTAGTQASGKCQGPVTLEAIPDRIPLRRWTPRTPSGGDWDDIAAQLGLRPKETAAPSEQARSEEISEKISVEAKETKGTSETTAPPPAALEWLVPVEQTIAPVPFDEASVVAVTLPPEEEAREVVQAEVAPEGDWLEEQVVAPAKGEDSTAPFLPVVEEILPPASAGRAVAADTATLQPVVADVSSGASASETEALPGERKKRRKRRRKKRSGAAPVSPEPFEEELPEIVELAVSGAEANGETGESPEQAEATETIRERPEVAPSRKRRSPASAKGEVEEEEDHEGEEEEIPRPSHKAVPGWAEVVGYVIQKNMEARTRRSGYGSRDRRR